MRVVSAPHELINLLRSSRSANKNIGFVPTMGALHDGHLRLIREADEANDVTVVSIFINPLQFNNVDDLANYPRVIEEDLEKLKGVGVDYVFTPRAEEMYPTKPIVSIDFGPMSKVMEGEFRKDHFEGVGLVVSKLFHIVAPDNAYFGLKDLQQFLLIRRMVKDLSFQLNVVGVDTVRESSGLAMSSRNRRLSEHGLEIASNLYKGLALIQEGIEQKKELDRLIEVTHAFYNQIDGLDIEYLTVVEAKTLQEIDSYQNINELAVCIAGYVEGVRLIDNLYLRLK